MRHHGEKWKRLPGNVRKPLVLIIGMTLVVMSPLLGWLPGPGGIPMFLAGVAILATEFSWAERFRDLILYWIKLATSWYQQHYELGNVLLAVSAAAWIIIVSMLFL